MIAPTKSEHSVVDDRDRTAALRAEELVKRFQATGDVACRDAVIKQYWGCLVKRANSHPAKQYVPVEELVSYGCDGMFAAIRLWKPESNVSFGHFLKRKIGFAIQDGLRSMCQSTRTQRERGEVKQFNRLSSVGVEGARDHAAFEEFDRSDEYDETIRRVPMCWLERVVVRLTHAEGWTPEEIAEPLDLVPAEVRQILRSVLARLGDGTDEAEAKKSAAAAKAANQRHKAKTALASAERELVAVLRDVDLMLDHGQEQTAVRLLLGMHHRIVGRGFDWAAAVLRQLAAAALVRGVKISPEAYLDAMQGERPTSYVPAWGRDYVRIERPATGGRRDAGVERSAGIPADHDFLAARSDWLLDGRLTLVDRCVAIGADRHALRLLLAFAHEHAIGPGRAAGSLRQRIVKEARRRGIALRIERREIEPARWWRLAKRRAKTACAVA